MKSLSTDFIWETGLWQNHLSLCQKKMMSSLHISILYHAVSHRRKAFFFTITAPYLRAVMASGKLYNNCCDYTLSTRNSEEFCYFKAVKIEMIYCKKSDDNI